MSFAERVPALNGRLSLAMALALILVACSPAPPPADVVASTDLGDIHRIELEEFIVSQPEARRSPPSGMSVAEWRRQMLEELITGRALENEARSLGLAETPEGKDLLASRVDPVLIQTMSARLIDERVEVTEEDLRAFYDANHAEFSHPQQIRVRNIFRRVDREASPEVWEAARQEVEGLLDEIRRGANFGDLARAHSDSETAPMAGLIGRVDRGHLAPELEAVLWSMDEGEVSGAIRTPIGFHLFKVEKRLEKFKMDFEDARTRLGRRLTREAKEDAERAVFDELIEESGAVYDPNLLMNEDDETVLFSLGEDDLTITEFFDYLDSISFSDAREQSLRRHLDGAVRQRLYLWKANESGLAGEPEITARLEQLERGALIDLAARTYQQAQIDDLNEVELREFYASREKRFQTPRLMNLRILTRNFPDEGSWYGVFEELSGLGKEIRSGRRDFARAARELSDDFSARQGGDVGAIRMESMAEWAGPAAQKKVLDLAVGDLSEPILIEHYNRNRLTYDRSGYMLVRLETIVEPRTRPFDEVRETVIEQFLEQGDEDVHQSVRREIMRSVGTEIYEENL